MRHFAALYRRLDRSTATLDKRAALVDYFRVAPGRDAAWALWLLGGGKIGDVAIQGNKARIASSGELRAWIAQASNTPDWLVDASYDQVGDLAEMLALLLDDPPTHAEDVGLADWIETRLAPLALADANTRRAAVVAAWRGLPFDERLVFNKLLTGALRVGVSQGLVQQALAQLSGLDIALIAQRMLGAWTPSETFLHALLSHDAQSGDAALPYPFFLASPLEHSFRQKTTKHTSARDDMDDAETAGLALAESEAADNDLDAVARALGAITDWQLEWKWDGIRVQLIRRRGDLALWSRGEERMDGRFPEIETALAALPGDAVIDGELLAWRDTDLAPLPFTALQTRIQRRKPGPKILAQTPARVLAYDLLELDGEDLRAQPLRQRRALLEDLLARSGTAPVSACAQAPMPARIDLSARLDAQSWREAAALRDSARGRGVEGLMLKRLDSPYRHGRKRGDWWKWKVDPLTIDAVLLYAQSGHGRRSTLYTDYTFGLWDGAALVPVAKAYSGLDDQQILQLDRWIRAHTTQRFGPVRALEQVQVFELGFEAVHRSNRHKSGVAVRFPRILRWRQDKPVAEADTLDALQALAR